ncbi:hypothetical protein LCGC14_2550490, partial [marine sediment metagenome]
YKEPTMSTYIERMIEEQLQLRERLRKLEAFIDTPKFDGLDELDRNLLRSQSWATINYLEILAQRIERAD